MNILLTSVGRRSYLVKYFKQAIGESGIVVAANSDPLTSGMIVADKAYTVPKVNSDHYIDELLGICKKEKISLVLSLFDIDLPYLSKARSRFENIGVTLVVSEPWLIEIANDKWKTYNFLLENNVPTPQTFLKLDDVKNAIQQGQLSYPVIVKPRWGMGSISVFKAENQKELEFFFDYAQKEIEKSYLSILSISELHQSVIVQQMITGKEYGLDVFNNLQGKHLQTIIREKISMRSGETDMARIIENSAIIGLGNQLANICKHIGNMDVDVLEDKDGNIYVLEMNVRFGGGYPFSHIAGVNYPAALVAMVKGEHPVLNDAKIGCIGLKSIEMLEA